MHGTLPDTIAIDGPAASGKTSLGRALAEALDYFFLDTGLMYRALTLAALRKHVPAHDHSAAGHLARTLDLQVETSTDTRILLEGEDVTSQLRAPDVEANVSAYSAIPAVRTEMVRRQQEVAARGRAILAGRDIGTVVLPDAGVKFFLDATEEERAVRRSLQAGQWGGPQESEAARRDIAGRDRIDSTRKTSPLRPAEDAIVIDTSDLTLDQVIEFALERVQWAG